MTGLQSPAGEVTEGDLRGAWLAEGLSPKLALPLPMRPCLPTTLSPHLFPHHTPPHLVLP